VKLTGSPVESVAVAVGFFLERKGLKGARCPKNLSVVVGTGSYYSRSAFVAELSPGNLNGFYGVIHPAKIVKK
jgi:hypothetical protein